MPIQKCFTKKLFFMTNERAVQIIGESIEYLEGTPAWDLAWVFLNEDIAEDDVDGWLAQDLDKLLHQFPEHTLGLLDDMVEFFSKKEMSSSDLMKQQAFRLTDVMMAMSGYAKTYHAIYKESQR
jgi:hypothetical protein